MTIVAVSGDAATTSTVALAATWPLETEVVLVEADPDGGDIAAWFDMPISPSLSTVVTRGGDVTWADIDKLTRSSPSGLRVIPAPSRRGEARQAIAESARSVVFSLATVQRPIILADIGASPPTVDAHPFSGSAAVQVIVHRQSVQSSRAAAVRLQRLISTVELTSTRAAQTIVIIIGAQPFDIEEVERFVHDSAPTVPVMGWPLDQLSAAVLAGRSGVSSRRLQRLPLMRAAAATAASIDSMLASPSPRTAKQLGRNGDASHVKDGLR